VASPEPKANLADLAAKERAAALVGTVVSRRYRILELIAMGGVGAVYLAEHVHMHKHMAVKVLHPDAQGLPDIVARFEREAVAGAHISHPNVAAATDFGELDDGSFFLVLEYVRGTTLREVIKRGPLPAARAAGIAKQIAAALGAVHAMDIVHRDVKPRNVMLIEGERDVVKLIDFGLAKLDLKRVSARASSLDSDADHRITGTGAVFGTIAYLAPEGAMGMDAVDARADLYALGVVLYEMLAGLHPFDTTDPVELFKRHHKDRPPPIAERAPGVTPPAALEAVAMRLLEKAPDARYAKAEEVVAAIDAAMEGTSPTPPPVTTMGSREPVFPGPSIPPPAFTSSPTPISIQPGLVPGPAIDPTPPPAPSTLPATLPSAGQEPPPASPAAAAPAPAALASTPPPRSEPAPLSAPAKPFGVHTAPPRRLWPYTVGLAVAAVAAVAIGWPALGDRLGGLPEASSASTAAVAPPTAPHPAATTAPVATATATAKPPAPRPAASGPYDGAAARAMLRRAVPARDFAHGAEAFFAIADHEPAAFAEPALLVPTRDLAAGVALGNGPDADRVFDTLARRLGSPGPDILYEIVRTRGGSKAAARAEALLAQPDVAAIATPALRITFALRAATCGEKAALLDRAAAEGDARTLVVMETTAAACLGRSKALLDARDALKARLKGAR
jgi:serine/threonine-protein kinase